MREKSIRKMWLSYGRLSGFGLGFSVSKYQATFDLGFWYIGLEY
jgi:hypothetical protein